VRTTLRFRSRASILECGGVPPLLPEDIEFLPRAFDLVCFSHPLKPREMPPHKAPRERGALQDASRTPCAPDTAAAFWSAAVCRRFFPP
jgi:hypothetical protein